MDIDGLQIEITENSEKAVAGLDALSKSLERLKKVTGGLEKSLQGVDFSKFTDQMKKLSTALQPLQGFKTQASGLLSSLRHFTIMAEDFNSFTRFDKFALQIQLLANSLQPLANFSTKLGATLNALSQVSVISEQLMSVDFGAFGGQITALTQSLSPLGTIQSKLGSTLNQLSRFGQVTQQLDMVLKKSNVSDNILELVKALQPLTTIGKSQLGSVLNQLKKLPELASQLASVDIDAFAERIRKVADAMRPLADEMNKVATGFSAFPARIQRLITQNERLSVSNRGLSKTYNILGISIKAVYAKLGVLYLGLRRVARVMAEWVEESNKYVENLNLFRVSMRGAADEALEYAFRVRDAFGIDPSEWIRYQAVFQNMATGFGIASDKAAIMSKALTQLGYDLATIFNVDYDIAMEKLESALAGQPRPMREWGFDMSEATLKLVAMKLGIEENVETMTQFEKAQLRFVQLMDTARKQGILGNFAREIHTPANAMRILNQEIKLLRRALGDLLIPVLIKVLPYLQAFVKLLAEAVRNAAIFMGFELPKIDYSSVEEVSSGFEEATENANKLKNTLAPFDEINLLQLEDSLSNINQDLGIDFSQYDYDFLTVVENRANEIAEKLQKPFERILELATTIGIVIASWKVSNALYSLFTGGGTNAFFNAVNALGKSFVSPSGETIKLASMLGNSTAYVGTAAVITGIAATIAVIVSRTIDLVRNSEKFRKGLETIWDGLKKAVNWITETAMPAIGGFFANLIPEEIKNAAQTIFEPIGKAMKVLDIDSKDWLLTLGSIALLFTPAAPFSAAVLIFEGITLGIRALGWAASDCIEEIDVLGEGISDITRQKMEPFLEQMRDLEDTLVEIDWTNMIIDDSIVQDIGAKVQAISKTIIDELDADKNEALRTLEPLRHALGEEAYNKLIQDNISYYDDLKEQVQANEERIIEIYRKAAEEHRQLTEEEKAEVNRIQAEMRDMGIRHLSETEIEYQTIMNRLKDNATRISLEQASEIIKNAQMTRDEAIAAAETQYAKIQLEAQRMYEAGAINKEQYEAIIKAAQQARDDAIAAANEQYDSIHKTVIEKLGDTAKYINTETGEIKTKWQVFCDNMKTWWGETWDKIGEKWNEWKEKFSGWFEEFKRNFKQGWFNFWYGIGNFFIDVWNGIVGGIEGAVNFVIDGLNDLIDKYNSAASKIPGIGASITIGNITSISLGRVARLSVPTFAIGGFPSFGELFIAREAGPELVGTIGRRTAVANNDQIVEAVAQGVYEAVSMAMRLNTREEGSREIVLNLDGRTIARMQLQRLNEEAQRLGYAPILRYVEGRV